LTVGATDEENDQRWDPWPKVALYVVILVFAGAVVFSAWGGGSLLEAVAFMCVMLTGVLALNVWRRRT
jgi:protein-S-isoprenylcysteine O-methyltransferase Ste14